MFFPILCSIFFGCVQFARLFIHQTCTRSRLLPTVVILDKTSNAFVWQLKSKNYTLKPSNLFANYHLPNSVKTFSVKLKCLLKQHFILNRPFIWKWCEVGQVQNSSVQVMFVPEKHSQCLFSIVAIFVFCQHNVLFH